MVVLFLGTSIWTQVGAATCRWAPAGRPRRPCLPLSLNVLPCAAPIWPQTDNLCDKAVCPLNTGSVEVGSAGAHGGRGTAGGSGRRLARPQPACPASSRLCPCPATLCPHEQVRYSQHLPAITPRGSFSVTLNGYTGNDQLFCVQVPFQVGAGARSWA